MHFEQAGSIPGCGKIFFFSKVSQKHDPTVTCSISVTANDSNSPACQLHRPTLAQQLVPSTGNCGKTENETGRDRPLMAAPGLPES